MNVFRPYDLAQNAVHSFSASKADENRYHGIRLRMRFKKGSGTTNAKEL